VRSDKGLLEQATRVANIILGGTGVVCLLVLFYFLYHYSLTGKRQFTSSVGMIVYYIFPAFLAGLLLASLRLSPSHKMNLSLFVASSVVSIYALELLLSPSDIIDEHARKSQELAKQFGRTFDTRTRLEVVNDLRKKGLDAYPMITPVTLLKEGTDGRTKSAIAIDNTEVLPLAGISSKVTVLCNENGDYTIYEADEKGFHNPRGIWSNGNIVIAAVGNSFTHGWCVPSDKNFVALIRKRYPATLNLGMGGNGPLLVLATIMEYAKLGKPKIVLWCHTETDLEELTRETRSPLLMRYMEQKFNQGLFSRQAAIDLALATHVEAEVRKVERPSKKSMVSKLNATMKLNDLRQRLGLIYGKEIAKREDPSSNAGPDMNLLREVLLQAKKNVSDWAGRLYFVYLPTRQLYANPEVANPQRDRVLLLARAIDRPIIDVHHAFQVHSDPLALFPFRHFPHYNEEGYRIVAKELFRLVSHGERSRLSN